MLSHFYLSPIAISVLILFPLSSGAKLHFDPSMISADTYAVSDLSQFEQGGTQLPGDYSVDIYLNGNHQTSQLIHFISAQNDSNKTVDNSGEIHSKKHDDTGLIACLTKKNLDDMGVNISGLTLLNTQPDGQCISPEKYIPDAYTTFNFQKMRLDISIPQAAMKNRPHGWIPPERWDEGINAALLSYQFSGSGSHGNNGNSRSNYLNLSSGLNLGAWRLRDNSTWSDYKNRYGHRISWQHLNTYVQRTIIPLRSELTMGESFTDSDVFDSLSFLGIQLSTDDNMYPDTMRGYAPEIKGIAYSNAQVSIRQRGNLIYRTFVAPGAFLINDLYPVSSGGDLELQVKEADGSLRFYTIPYSSVPVLQRQGHLRYALTAGRYQNNSSSYSSPSFAQGTLLWGLPHDITAYSGIQVAENYRAIALGAGINIGVLGAFSADITQADSTLMDGSHHDGQSIRFLYSRSMVSTGTTLQFAGYRYSTQGFHTLDETALKGMSGWLYNTDYVDPSGKPNKVDWLNYYNIYNNKRERLQINVSQRLGNLGSLYLTGSRQTYWRGATTTNTLQAGYNSHWGTVSYNLSYNYSRVSGQPTADKALFFSLSVPLDTLLSHNNRDDYQHQIRATFSSTRDNDGNLNHQAGLSGTLLEDNNLNWALSQAYERNDVTNSDANLDYKGTYGKVSAGYGYSNDYRQIRYGASGGMVLTSSGLTMGQQLGTTNILVAAPGATGVAVENQNGVQTDWRGYTVIPWASIYRENRVALDVSRLDENVDIDNAVTRVVPTRGALVRADFNAHSGIRALITLLHNGKPVPFGAMVSTSGGGSNGIVGDDGVVYLSGLSEKGSILAKWGNRSDQQCTVHYQQKSVPFIQTQENCR